MPESHRGGRVRSGVAQEQLSKEREEMNEFVDSHATDSVRLHLSPVGEQRRDNVCIDVTFRNETSDPIGWDREFAVFMIWHVIPDDANKGMVATTTEERVRQTKESLSKDRFVKVSPQGSLSKTICLTMPFRCFRVEAWGGSAETRHPSHFEGYEALQRYHFDNRTKKVTVSLEYNRWVHDASAFAALFGFDPSKVGLWKGPIGRIESNELVIQFK
jgi:hypothetical protein